MLEAHLSRQRGAAGLIGARDRDLNVLRGKLRASQLENSNLARDKARLTALVNKHLPGIQGQSAVVPRWSDAAPSAAGGAMEGR